MVLCSAAAGLGVEDAARLARDRGAELLVLFVRPDRDVRAVVDPAKAADPAAYLARIGGRFPGLITRTRAEDGDPAERIVEVASKRIREQGLDRPGRVLGRAERLLRVPDRLLQRAIREDLDAKQELFARIEAHADDETIPEVLYSEGYTSLTQRFRPSTRLVRKAARSQHSETASWKLRKRPGQSEMTVLEGADWAICTPVRSQSCNGWFLYIAGRATAGALVRQAAQSLDLKGDVAGGLDPQERRGDLPPSL